MNRYYFLLFALFGGLSLQAQFGLQATANFNSSSSVFVEGIGEVDVLGFDKGAEIALNYWFRLPNQRLEFLPTLFYAQSSDDWSSPDDNVHLKEFGAQFKVNVYPFDFLGDCDCPTFGKQGPQLQKGLFFQLSGGYSLYRADYDFEIASQTIEGGAFTYGGGIGLDIGLSNLVTITPIASVRVGTKAYQELQYTDVNGQAIETNGPKLTSFQLGVLLSFRLDHKKY